MNKIEEMIKRLCPDGIEHRELREVATVDRGRRVVKKQLAQTGTIPVYQNSLLPLGFFTDSNFCGNTPFVIGAGAAGQVGYSSIDFWAADDCFPIVGGKEVHPRFIYHYLLSRQSYLDSHVRKASIPRISRSVIEKLVIPIPPMEIQEEIVRMLDYFEELEAELKAELEARKAQYAYYRDKLLDFSTRGGVALMPLGEIATIERGGSFQKKDYGNGSIGCIHYGQIYTHYGIYASSTISMLSQEYDGTIRWANSNDVIMAVTSENIDDVCKSTAWLGTSPIAISGHTAILRHSQNPKYLSYYFASKWFQQEKRKYAQGTKVIEVSPKKLAKVLIPIPSLEEQERIVNSLDKFDTLVNDISQGLPAEIEARRKQYEYYRDKLLTFNEKAA